MSQYTATVVWTRAPDAPFKDNKYSRAHEWRFDGGAVVKGSSAPSSVRVPLSDPTAVDPEEAPEDVTAAIDRKGRLDVGKRDMRYLPAVAAVLDVLAAHEGVLGDRAKQLGITSGNLSGFITGDEDVMVEANRIREHFGLRPLRP